MAYSSQRKRKFIDYLKELAEPDLVSFLSSVVDLDVTHRNFYSKVTAEKLETTTWGLLLNHANVGVVGSRQNNLFKARFRVPYQLFAEHLVPLCEQHEEFGKIDQIINVKYKVMIALRILGRDSCADSINELIGVGNSTINRIFKHFVMTFKDLFYDDYIGIPKGIQLAKTMEVFRQLGLPGCMGSMDATHVKWSKCPKSIRHLCMGKEGFPTLAFNVIVDHTKKVLHVSTAFMGATNDKTMCRQDQVIIDLIRGVMNDVEYVLYDHNGEPRLHNGAYVICDGGYLKFPVMMNPVTHSMEKDALVWSEWVESIRKDVECFFGILKQRWRFFKNGIEYHSSGVIDAAFNTCCIINNMILLYNGNDVLDNEEYWLKLDTELREEDCIVTGHSDAQVEYDVINKEKVIIDMLSLPRTKHLLRKGKSWNSHDQEQHPELRKHLMESFRYQYRYLGDLKWPRNMNPTVKHNIPDFMQRVDDSVYSNLYVKPSNYRALSTDGSYNKNIGNGLYSTMKFNKDDKIGSFVGDKISVEEYHQRSLAGHGGYAIKLNNDYIFDCYNFKESCKCSMANTANGLQEYGIVNTNNKKANNNCKISIVDNVPILKSSTKIKANEELLWPYGNSYNTGIFMLSQN